MSTSSVPLPPLPPVLEKIVRRLQQTTDPKRRYEYLLWLAKRLPALSEAQKTAENKVPGCVSQVFIVAAVVDGKVMFQADSDAQLTKGLVALLVEGLNGLTPKKLLSLLPISSKIRVWMSALRLLAPTAFTISFKQCSARQFSAN